MQVHLLHVNDVHSQIESYMRLGHQLRELRTELERSGDIVLTFDVGDLLDRVRPETEATMGRINVDLMAALGVDGYVFGNNEGLTIPVPDWAVLADRAKAVVFGTNLKDEQSRPFAFFEDYHIYEQKGKRIGVFGLTPNYRIAYDMLGVDAQDPTVRAGEIVTRLRQMGCHVVVCLSHLGRRTDHLLASSVPGIDVILGGHTHEFMTAAEWSNGSAIFQPGKFARAFGHTQISLDDGGRPIEVVSEAIPVQLATPYDPKMFAVYAEYAEQIRAVLSRDIAQLPTSLPMVYERESPFPNLLADVLFDECQGDFALMMTGALNASLLKGTVNLEQLLGACPTPTRPIVVTLSGDAVYDVFNQGIQPQTYGRHGIGFGFRGGKIGYLVVSGAMVSVARDADGKEYVQEISVQGVPVDRNRDYRVITCEYLWLSPVFEPFRAAREVTYQPPLVREVLLARLGEEGRIERALASRYTYET